MESNWTCIWEMHRVLSPRKHKFHRFIRLNTKSSGKSLQRVKISLHLSRIFIKRNRTDSFGSKRDKKVQVKDKSWSYKDHESLSRRNILNRRYFQRKFSKLERSGGRVQRKGKNKQWIIIIDGNMLCKNSSSDQLQQWLSWFQSLKKRCLSRYSITSMELIMIMFNFSIRSTFNYHFSFYLFSYELEDYYFGISSSPLSLFYSDYRSSGISKGFTDELFLKMRNWMSNISPRTPKLIYLYLLLFPELFQHWIHPSLKYWPN